MEQGKKENIIVDDKDVELKGKVIYCNGGYKGRCEKWTIEKDRA